jgi:hypothetical protein
MKINKENEYMAQKADQGTDNDKMNKKFINILANNKKSSQEDGYDVGKLPNKSPPTNGINTNGVMKSPLMTFTQMLESLDSISDNIDYASADNAPSDDLMDQQITDEPAPSSRVMGLGNINEDELLNQLNQIFTPILVMQSIEGNIEDQIHEACSEDNVLLERNILKFDDSTRMAQLKSVCALLIARQKNTQQYQMYKKASDVRNKMKLQIQKDEYANADALAQKFLVKASTSSNNSTVRNAARDLLPATQH